MEQLIVLAKELRQHFEDVKSNVEQFSFTVKNMGLLTRREREVAFFETMCYAQPENPATTKLIIGQYKNDFDKITSHIDEIKIIEEA